MVSISGNVGKKQARLLTQIVHYLTHLDHFEKNCSFSQQSREEAIFFPALLY